MGAKLAKLDEGEIGRLRAVTAFTENENQDWYRIYIREVPTGEMSKAEFVKIYQNFFPNGNPAPYCEFLFKRFHGSTSGSLTFKDFIIAVNVTVKGTIETKLEWAFQMYDLDGNGMLSIEEIATITEALYQVSYY